MLIEACKPLIIDLSDKKLHLRTGQRANLSAKIVRRLLLADRRSIRIIGQLSSFSEEASGNEHWERVWQELSREVSCVHPNDVRRQLLDSWLHKVDEAWLRLDFKGFMVAVRRALIVTRNISGGQRNHNQEGI